MKKFLVLLVCFVVLLVGDTVLDKSGIESSFDAKKACDGGDMLGCSNLGSMYAKGSGVEKDLGKAVELYKKACDGGDMFGCYNLGNMYSFSKAAELFKKACNGGEMLGCRNLGIMYDNGNGA